MQLVVGERCALAASSGLVNAAPDYASKRFLATQTLDEARHVEIFTQRLYDLGVKKDDLESTIDRYANPNLVKFAEVLLEKVDSRDFVAGVVGQNIVLEGMAFTCLRDAARPASRQLNPKFAHTLSGTIADERRHVGFGENRIGSLIQQYPEKKPEIEKMQKEMTYYMLATFADAFPSTGENMDEARSVVAEEAAAARVRLRRPRSGTAPTSATAERRGDGGGAGRHRARGVQDAPRSHRPRVPDARRLRSEPAADRAMTMSIPTSSTDARHFLDEVHSFEFWFQAVEGYLARSPLRSATPTPGRSELASTSSATG